MVYWLILGLLVIGALSAVALYYVLQLRRLRVKREAQANAYALAENESRTGIKKSIKIIARAFMAGQVEAAEACVRLTHLLDLLSVSGTEREPFVAIDKMAAAIAHIPIKEQWTRLPKAERRRFEGQIAKHEQELKEFIDVAMADIANAEF